ncbi:MAG: L-histidine N(alpha)-methyltransferase [Ignavibacteria bacterium]|nr:L-histidine N(alpha)-methyltransferase [Ignavibacteria bacterium]
MAILGNPTRRRSLVTPRYKVLLETDYADSLKETDAFALDVLVGLSAQNKFLPSKYLYDKEGSELYQKITQQDEYYPTAVELGIIRSHVPTIGRHVEGAPFHLVELGAGFSQKTVTILEGFVRMGLEFTYVPIDIAESAMGNLDRELTKLLPDLPFRGLVTDYFNGLRWLNNQAGKRNIVFFLGSSIGNFTSGESRFFLRNLWNCLKQDDIVVIGFDLKKDIELLLKAYNDREGVTSDFNLNLLRRINRELGGHFDLSKFRHFGTYDVFSGAMESYLVSLEAQSVAIDKIGRPFSFDPWEPIHTEYSYKYLITDIEKLAAQTGFEILEFFFDEKRYFTDSIWKVRKTSQ